MKQIMLKLYKQFLVLLLILLIAGYKNNTSEPTQNGNYIPEEQVQLTLLKYHHS